MQSTSSNPVVLSGLKHSMFAELEFEPRGPRAGSFPPIPTLLATRLQLQLLLSDRAVDLRAASGIILNDVGATLEIFRRAGQECGDEGPGTATRLEDCLASLGTDAWMDVVCANAVERVALNTPHLAELLGFWEHSRLLAYACSVVAEHSEGMCPEEAYLVGLLHEASRLPKLLGWSPAADAQRSPGRHEGFDFATHCCLPPYLHSVLDGASTTPPHWRGLLDMAHAWMRGESCILSCTA